MTNDELMDAAVEYAGQRYCPGYLVEVMIRRPDGTLAEVLDSEVAGGPAPVSPLTLRELSAVS